MSRTPQKRKPIRDRNLSNEISKPSKSLQNDKKTDINESDYKSSSSYQEESFDSSLQTSVNENKSFKKSLNINIIYNNLTTKNAILLIIGLFIIHQYCNSTDDLKQKTCSFLDIETQYPNQNSEIFKSLQIEIEDTLNMISNNLNVFLFVHNNSSFTNSLIDKILIKSSKCLDPKVSPIYLTNDDLSSDIATKDYGHVIVKFKQKIKKGNVLFVANLNTVPGTAARALHAICDTHNPIISPVFIFLTLIVNEYDIENPSATAHNTLFDLWKSQIQRNELDPLITRVTDQVFLLKEQRNI